MPNSALVFDANILIRAVLGIRVRSILERYADNLDIEQRRDIPGD